MFYQVSGEREWRQRITPEVPWRPTGEAAELLDARRRERDECVSALASLKGFEDVEEVVSLLARRDALTLLITALETPPPVLASASREMIYGRAPVVHEPTERERLEERRDFLRRQLSGDEEIPLTDSQIGARRGVVDYGGVFLRRYNEENRARVERELGEVEAQLAGLEDDEDAA